MSQEWTWTYADVSGAPALVEPEPGQPSGDTNFPTQADAEAWFAETWQDLAQAGVATVTLWCDGAEVYGPMSLAAD